MLFKASRVWVQGTTGCTWLQHVVGAGRVGDRHQSFVTALNWGPPQLLPVLLVTKKMLHSGKQAF